MDDLKVYEECEERLEETVQYVKEVLMAMGMTLG